MEVFKHVHKCLSDIKESNNLADFKNKSQKDIIINYVNTSSIRTNYNLKILDTDYALIKDISYIELYFNSASPYIKFKDIENKYKIPYYKYNTNNDFKEIDKKDLYIISVNNKLIQSLDTKIATNIQILNNFKVGLLPILTNFIEEQSSAINKKLENIYLKQTDRYKNVIDKFKNNYDLYYSKANVLSYLDYSKFYKYSIVADNLFYKLENNILKLLNSFNYIMNFDSFKKNKIKSNNEINMIFNKNTFEVIHLNNNIKNVYPFNFIKSNDKYNIYLSNTNINYESIYLKNTNYINKKLNNKKLDDLRYSSSYLPFTNNFTNSITKRSILYFNRKITLLNNSYLDQNNHNNMKFKICTANTNFSVITNDENFFTKEVNLGDYLHLGSSDININLKLVKLFNKNEKSEYLQSTIYDISNIDLKFNNFNLPTNYYQIKDSLLFVDNNNNIFINIDITIPVEGAEIYMNNLEITIPKFKDLKPNDSFTNYNITDFNTNICKIKGGSNIQKNDYICSISFDRIYDQNYDFDASYTQNVPTILKKSQTGGNMPINNLKTGINNMFSQSQFKSIYENELAENKIENEKFKQNFKNIYLNMKLNGYYINKQYLDSLPENIINDFKKSKKEIAGKYLKFCNLESDYINHNHYGLNELNKKNNIKTTLNLISDIFQNMFVTSIENNRINLNSDNLILIDGTNKSINDLKNSKIIFLTDIYESKSRDASYKKNTSYDFTSDIVYKNLFQLSNNQFKKYVIIVKNNAFLTNNINKINKETLLNISSITNINFFKDYLVHIIHYIYDSSKRSIIESYYNNINKNIFEEFIPEIYNTKESQFGSFYIKPININNKELSLFSQTSENLINNLKCEVLKKTGNTFNNVDKDNFNLTLDKQYSLIYKLNSKYYTYLIGKFTEENSTIYFNSTPLTNITNYGLHNNNLLYNKEINIDKNNKILKLDNTNNFDSILSISKNDNTPVPLDFFLTKFGNGLDNNNIYITQTNKYKQNILKYIDLIDYKLEYLVSNYKDSNSAIYRRYNYLLNKNIIDSEETVELNDLSSLIVQNTVINKSKQLAQASKDLFEKQNINVNDNVNIDDSEEIEIGVPEEETDAQGNKKIVLKWKSKNDVLQNIKLKEKNDLFIQIKPFNIQEIIDE